MLQSRRNVAKTSQKVCFLRSGLQCLSRAAAHRLETCPLLVNAVTAVTSSHCLFFKKTEPPEYKCSVWKHRLFSRCLGLPFFCDLVKRHGLTFNSSNPVSLILLSPLISKMISLICYKGSYMTLMHVVHYDIKYSLYWILLNSVFYKNRLNVKRIYDFQMTACRICNNCDPLMCYFMYLMAKQFFFLSNFKQL